MSPSNFDLTIYPKRVVWVQDEDTGKWVLVGLSADGEVQDPKDYEDVSMN